MISNRFVSTFLFAVACSGGASAQQPKNYFSMKYGLAQSNMAFNNDAKFENDDGSIKDVEFFWGNSTLAKWIGGVRITPNNRYGGFLLGVVIDDKHVVSVRQLNTDDVLLKGETDIDFSRRLSFGKVKASATEYKWVFSRNDSEFWNLTYGNSTYPAMVYVSAGPLLDDEESFFDPRPEFHYAHVGFEIDPIKAALLNGNEIRENEFASDWLYFTTKIGFGAYTYELSDVQYSRVYKNPEDRYGLKNDWCISPSMATNYELGVHTATNVPLFHMAGTLGYFYQPAPMSFLLGLYKFCETPTGYHSRADGSVHHGIVGRLAVAF